MNITPSDKLNSLITDFSIAQELYLESMRVLFYELLEEGKIIQQKYGLEVLLQFITDNIPECSAKRVICLDIESQINNCKNDEGC